MERQRKKKGCFILAFLVAMILFLGIQYSAKVSAATVSYGTVTANSLNVRKKADVTSESLGTIQKGTQVTVHSSKKDTNGKKWYNITVSIANKDVTGYVSSSYVDLNKQYDFVIKTGSTNATVLNIRKSTSTTSTVLAKVSKGTRVTILSLVTVNKTKWIKIKCIVNGKEITGYTHSKYVDRDKTTISSNQYLLGISNSEGVVVYNKANTYTKLKAKLVKNQEVIILGSVSVNQVAWYKVKLKMNGSNVYGYVKASLITKLKGTASSTESLAGKITKETGTYKIASTVSKKLKTLSVGQNVTVKGSLTVNGVKWYRITYTISKNTETAYVKTSCVQLNSDALFEQSIAAFPSNYRSYLRNLHDRYPEWLFVPVNTGLDWNTVIENESKVGRNTIQSNVPKGGSVTSYSAPFSYLSTAAGAYNWATDTYTLMDGSNWYTAAKEVIAYYMDPRNSLTPERIWQFEALAYDENQDIQVVKKILENTFMKDSYSCIDSATNKKESGTYSNLFMEAGIYSGSSPYFLASRAKQELGTNGSGSSSGAYPGYEGIYNFFNIGANDSSTGQAIANGLRWASSGTTYMRPWTSIKKAIMGGASYIATSYINKGQNTLYTQKFNVVYAPFFSHQYMTNVMAPSSESRTQYNSYQSLDIMNESYVFYIPVYTNMPTTAAALPVSKGNPNSYIKSLSATYGSKKLALTPTFNYLTTSYTMVVDADVSEITLKGEAVSKYASLSGLGTYQLTPGKTTTITIKCKAQNQTVTTYTLKVSRLMKEG